MDITNLRRTVSLDESQYLPAASMHTHIATSQLWELEEHTTSTVADGQRFQYNFKFKTPIALWVC